MRKYISLLLLGFLLSPLSATSQTIEDINLGLEGHGGIWTATVPNSTFALIKTEGDLLVMVVLHPYEIATLADLLAISELPDWEAYMGNVITGESEGTGDDTGNGGDTGTGDETSTEPEESFESYALEVAQFNGNFFSPNVIEANMNFLGEDTATLEMVSCLGPFCLFSSTTTTLFTKVF